MSPSDNQESLVATVAELTTRLAALEGRTSSASGREDPSDRRSREREERKVASDLEDFAKQQRGQSDSRPVNPRRYEAMSRSTTTVKADAASPRPVKTKTTDPVSGKAVEFYTWKDGAVGKLKILTEGEFTPIE